MSLHREHVGSFLVRSDPSFSGEPPSSSGTQAVGEQADTVTETPLDAVRTGEQGAGGDHLRPIQDPQQKPSVYWPSAIGWSLLQRELLSFTGVEVLRFSGG